MLSIGIQYKSATPMKVITARCLVNKFKNTAFSVLYFECSSNFCNGLTIPLQENR
jgi:hypothetical protein